LVEVGWKLLEKAEDIGFDSIVSLRSLALDCVTLILRPK